MSKSILIVEDNKATAVIIQKYIIDFGYSISSVVSSGEEAIQRVKELLPDLVLMDITLDGEMDGIDSAMFINDILNIPVIYITSSSDNATLERAKSTNPFGFIIKPIDKKELKASIEMAFLRYNMEKKLKENEQKFSIILNSIGDAVIVMDSCGIITYMNPLAERISGWSVEEASGRKLNEIVNLEHNGFKHINEDDLIHQLEYVYLTSRNGKRIPVDYNVAPIQDSNETLSGNVIVLRDDTGRVNAELKIQENLRQLRKIMSGIIHAMAYAIETRDPYTAGHQRRVADLAWEIASEMNLHYKIVEGISMSGMIHDLGKISVPAEILSKPGKLTSMEFNLIKIHPQNGFEILKSIDFPWPVAEIIYQHHERLDGSGYPRALTGKDILIEARIIAVADVVEAMASHRPYRPALGIDNALDEIFKNKRDQYDRDVVKACIKIFKEKGYEMKYE